MAEPNADLSFLSDAIHLVAIHPDGGPPRAQWFGDDRARAEAWANIQNGEGFNVYFTANKVRPELNKKPTKKDIEGVRYCFVDIDPPFDEGEVWAKAHRFGLPSIAIHSGNGLQLLWRVEDGRSVEQCELINRGLVDAFGGDKGCWNVDRLLRVPGTINHPNATKRAKGRRPELAWLMWVDDVSYLTATMLETFPAPPREPREVADVVLGAYEPTLVEDLTRRPSEALLRRLNTEHLPGERSEACMRAAKWMLHEGYTREDVAGVMFEPGNAIAAHVFDKDDPQRAAERIASNATARPKPEEVFGTGYLALPAGASPVPLPRRAVEVVMNEPFSLAQSLLTTWGSRLAHYQDEFFEWREGAYIPLSEGTIRANAWNHLKTLVVRDRSEVKKLNVKPHLVSGTIDALRALTHVRPDRFPEPPFWLDGGNAPDARSLLSTRTGLIDPATGETFSTTDELFTLNVIGCEYRPDAPSPRRWLRFLEEIWPDEGDAECVRALRQFMGYLLTPDTRHQKALMMVGPKRSGKGTIIRVIQELVGRQNTVAPSLGSLGGDFGLQPLLGKLVALVSDARLDTRHATAVTENLLRITGEDQVTVNRKNLSAVTVTLPVRFVLATNEVLRWPDREGALANRFIVLPMRRSFYGKEDVELSDVLRTELSGILNWAIEGLREVRSAGRLAQPDAGADVVRDMEHLSSPIRSFVEARCRLSSELSIEKAKLFDAFRTWHRSEIGVEYARSAETFGRDLMAAASGSVTTTRARKGETRRYLYSGIDLKQAS